MGMEKLELTCVTGGSIKWYWFGKLWQHLENLKHTFIFDSAISFLDIYPPKITDFRKRHD